MAEASARAEETAGGGAVSGRASSGRASAGGAASGGASSGASFRLPPESQTVFAGLLLGMFVAAVSQTIVGPAMPRIIAELGGMDHYSWVATSSLLVSAVTTPIVGKLSDLYGRKRFYLGGLAAFLIGSIVSGLAPSFGVLIVGRALQGMGMGTLMPLSQTILGDIVPPRQRGKYQGYMGAMFGVATVLGPFAGGVITDAWGWRWLFFVSIPIGLVGLVIIARFMRLPHERREARVDVGGMVTLTFALVALLLATSWGGSTFPWVSLPVLGLYGVGVVALAGFVWIETRVAEPVVPLHLFRNATFTLSNIAAFFVGMMMFGVLIYVPVFAQGVLGVDATVSGLVLMPMNIGQILMGIAVGLLITRTGRYKEFMIGGVLLLALGQYLLTRLGWESGPWDIALAVGLFGVGLGSVLQQYTLLIQNGVGRRDLGVATAASQFFRSVGSTVGIAVYGSVLTVGLPAAIARYLPEGMAPVGQEINAGSVLDPSTLAQVPDVVAEAVRRGLADQMHLLFLVGLPFALVVLLATLGIPHVPLRETVHSPDEARREYLDTMALSTASAETPSLAEGRAPRTRERVLGIQLRLLAQAALSEDRPLLRRAITEVGGGDFQRGVRLVARTADMLTTEDPEVAARAEPCAVEVAALTRRKGGLLSPGLRSDLAVAAAAVPPDKVLQGAEPTLGERYEALDVGRLREAGSELASALLVDLAGAARTGAARTTDAETPAERPTQNPAED